MRLAERTLVIGATLVFEQIIEGYQVFGVGGAQIVRFASPQVPHLKMNIVHDPSHPPPFTKDVQTPALRMRMI
jgi:hypothetical protein